MRSKANQILGDNFTLDDFIVEVMVSGLDHGDSALASTNNNDLVVLSKRNKQSTIKSIDTKHACC